MDVVATWTLDEDKRRLVHDENGLQVEALDEDSGWWVKVADARRQEVRR